MRELGFDDIDVDELVSLGSHDVSPAFVKEIRGLVTMT